MFFNKTIVPQCPEVCKYTRVHAPVYPLRSRTAVRFFAKKYTNTGNFSIEPTRKT